MDGRLIINASHFDTCKIDGVTKKEILKGFSGRENGVYYLNKFENYLKRYNISLKEYIVSYLGFSIPKNDRGGDLGFQIRGFGVSFSMYRKGGVNKSNCPAFVEGCKKLSEDRKKSGNPMYGKNPWNLKRRYSIPKARGRKISESWRNNLRAGARRRTIHGHTGIPHSAETKIELAKITAKRYELGTYKNRESSIHVIVRDFLDDIKEDYVEEKNIFTYSVDFYLPKYNLCLEVQGNYFHINEKYYPNGPKSKAQIRNFGRDGKKKQYLESNGYTLFEVWEDEVNNGTFKNKLICEFKRLGL